jgi:hypothetical protein
MRLYCYPDRSHAEDTIMNISASRVIAAVEGGATDRTH